MTTQKWYVLPAESFTDEATGETAWRPKYLETASGVEGYNGSWIPAPGSFPGQSNPQGEIYIGNVLASQSAHDAAASQSDVWSIGSNGDVTPTQAADYLNNEFRVDLSGIGDAAVVSAFEELFQQLGPEYRRLSPQEWADRLGGGSFS